MNDKSIKKQQDKGVYSLRQRYLFVSSIIVILIFAAAWYAQSYVIKDSAQHRDNIELRHQATRYIRQLRNEILHVEKGLEAFMWSPSGERRQKVHHSIDSAIHYFDLLRQHQWMIQSKTEPQLGDFALDLKALHPTLDHAMDMRQQGLDLEDKGRNSNNISYLKHTVEPHFEHLWHYLGILDGRIDEHFKNDAIALGSTASMVAKVVWMLSILGLSVITIAYLYFRRTVLMPIATVATALKREAAGEPVSPLPQVHNLETRHLIQAFDEMRHQVQDRQQALEHLAMHDSLTALPNRYHLMSRLQTICKQSEQTGAIFAVIMLGLDRFKEINDSLGQHTGDDILKKFGQRLRFMLRDSDSVARFASDEFAVLLSSTNREEALYVARKIHREMEHPFDVDGISIPTSCSIGIALYPEHGEDKEVLTRRANIAMAAAKQHRTGIAFYEERFDTSSVERIALAGELRQAIQQNRLRLSYQPQYAVHSGRLSGVEVLCRWDDPQRGRVCPNEFVLVAEHTGQIQALTEWVLNTALQQAQQWREKRLDCGILSINISAFNLHAPNFISMLEKQLKKWSFPVNKLMLEITETAMMADPEHAISTLRKLHRLGVKLSIDDYGTGFSSLSYVKQLPVDELKIDKSFVMDMNSNENDALIVRSTIDLAHNLGLRVVAEGVDTQEKQDLLEILDCDYLQGHHLGRPMSAEKLERILPPIGERESKVHHLRDYR